MQIKRIDFIAPVNFGGTLKSISTRVSGARPGETRPRSRWIPTCASCR